MKYFLLNYAKIFFNRNKKKRKKEFTLRARLI